VIGGGEIAKALVKSAASGHLEAAMNSKTGVTILAVVCAGLAVALIVIKMQSNAQSDRDATTISTISNQLDKASASITDLNQVNLALNNEIATNRENAAVLSNRLAESAATLASMETTLVGAQEKITNLNGRISDLETQNRSLDQRLLDLTNAMTTLDAQITATERKLATSETNNAYLSAELKRQVAERAELERKFNDLQTVRSQVKKLKDDLLVARRLEWIRQGIDPNKPMKGGQLLMQHSPPPSSSSSPNYNLNVEVGSEGTVRVIPSTNAPAPAP
jgi:predicted  nucleic acid-binding Zn-ribbon protein